jgi:uncharacterized BrkB/YihY/UPF0761 family membrane protein
MDGLPETQSPAPPPPVRPRRGEAALFWGLGLIVIGGLFLLRNFDVIPWHWHLWRLWPVVLIAFGLWMLWCRLDNRTR